MLEEVVVILTKGLCTCSDDPGWLGGHTGVCRIESIASLIDSEELKKIVITKK